ncbi:MAG TPA: hypothetical protein VIJ57_08665, partial [Hanamia sp.]
RPLNVNHRYSLLFNGKAKPVDITTYFSHKMDTDWANLFWSHSLDEKKKFDKSIMNFLRAIIVNNYAGLENTEHLKILINRENENISFQQYLKYGCLNEKVITDLILILDLIKNGNEKVREYLPNFYSYKEKETFETIIYNNFNQAGYVERIKFHAYCQYLIKWKAPDGFNDLDGLKKWMRIIQNLTDNTAPYNNEREFINSVESINLLIPKSNEIFNHLISLLKLNGFDEIQFKEEKIKAILITKDSVWEELIYSIEQRAYFNGQIGFILFLCGIEDFYINNGDCSWSEEENKQYQNSFQNVCNKALKIFNDEGLGKFPDFIWERALLTKGDYLIQEGSNQSFLINRDRDISWKRLLKRDKKHNHEAIIKEIFNAIDLNDVKGSLIATINNYEDDGGWKMEFIKNPRLFEYLGPKRYVRQCSNHGFVLFRGERMSGEHAELFTYSFYLNRIQGKSFLPFENTDRYSFKTGDDSNDDPCIKLAGCCINKIYYSIEVYFSNVIREDFPYNYQIRFQKVKGDKSFEKYPDDIKDILHRCKFKWYDEEKEWAGFWCTKNTASESEFLIKKLCSLLIEI